MRQTVHGILKGVWCCWTRVRLGQGVAAWLLSRVRSKLRLAPLLMLDREERHKGYGLELSFEQSVDSMNVSA